MRYTERKIKVSLEFSQMNNSFKRNQKKEKKFQGNSEEMNEDQKK